jgi:hypothetical protein
VSAIPPARPYVRYISATYSVYLPRSLGRPWLITKTHHSSYIHLLFTLHINISLSVNIMYTFPATEGSLSLLRCCSHNLQVEMGRHTGIEYQHRLCVMCNQRDVEDEYNFTLVCPFYHSLRKCYIPHKFIINPNKPKFTVLMSTSNTSIITALAAYVYHAFKLRNNHK